MRGAFRTLLVSFLCVLIFIGPAPAGLAMVYGQNGEQHQTLEEETLVFLNPFKKLVRWKSDAGEAGNDKIAEGLLNLVELLERENVAFALEHFGALMAGILRDERLAAALEKIVAEKLEQSEEAGEEPQGPNFTAELMRDERLIKILGEVIADFLEDETFDDLLSQLTVLFDNPDLNLMVVDILNKALQDDQVPAMVTDLLQVLSQVIYDLIIKILDDSRINDLLFDIVGVMAEPLAETLAELFQDEEMIEVRDYLTGTVIRQMLLDLISDDNFKAELGRTVALILEPAGEMLAEPLSDLLADPRLTDMTADLIAGLVTDGVLMGTISAELKDIFRDPQFVQIIDRIADDVVTRMDLVTTIAASDIIRHLLDVVVERLQEEPTPGTGESFLLQEGRLEALSGALFQSLRGPLSNLAGDERLKAALADALDTASLEGLLDLMLEDSRVTEALKDAFAEFPLDELVSFIREDKRLSGALDDAFANFTSTLIADFLREDPRIIEALKEALASFPVKDLTQFLAQGGYLQGVVDVLMDGLAAFPMESLASFIRENNYAAPLGYTISYSLLHLLARFVEEEERLDQFFTRVFEDDERMTAFYKNLEVDPDDLSGMVQGALNMLACFFEDNERVVDYVDELITGSKKEGTLYTFVQTVSTTTKSIMKTLFEPFKKLFSSAHTLFFAGRDPAGEEKDPLKNLITEDNLTKTLASSGALVANVVRDERVTELLSGKVSDMLEDSGFLETVTDLEHMIVVGEFGADLLREEELIAILGDVIGETFLMEGAGPGVMDFKEMVAGFLKTREATAFANNLVADVVLHLVNSGMLGDVLGRLAEPGAELVAGLLENEKMIAAMGDLLAYAADPALSTVSGLLEDERVAAVVDDVLEFMLDPAFDLVADLLEDNRVAGCLGDLLDHSVDPVLDIVIALLQDQRLSGVMSDLMVDIFNQQELMDAVFSLVAEFLQDGEVQARAEAAVDEIIEATCLRVDIIRRPIARDMLHAVLGATLDWIWSCDLLDFLEDFLPRYVSQQADGANGSGTSFLGDLVIAALRDDQRIAGVLKRRLSGAPGELFGTLAPFIREDRRLVPVIKDSLEGKPAEMLAALAVFLQSNEDLAGLLKDFLGGAPEPVLEALVKFMAQEHDFDLGDAGRELGGLQEEILDRLIPFMQSDPRLIAVVADTLAAPSSSGGPKTTADKQRAMLMGHVMADVIFYLLADLVENRDFLEYQGEMLRETTPEYAYSGARMLMNLAGSALENNGLMNLLGEIMVDPLQNGYTLLKEAAGNIPRLTAVIAGKLFLRHQDDPLPVSGEGSGVENDGSRGILNEFARKLLEDERVIQTMDEIMVELIREGSLAGDLNEITGLLAEMLRHERMVFILGQVIEESLTGERFGQNVDTLLGAVLDLLRDQRFAAGVGTTVARVIEDQRTAAYLADLAVLLADPISETAADLLEDEEVRKAAGEVLAALVDPGLEMAAGLLEDERLQTVGTGLAAALLGPGMEAVAALLEDPRLKPVAGDLVILIMEPILSLVSETLQDEVMVEALNDLLAAILKHQGVTEMLWNTVDRLGNNQEFRAYLEGAFAVMKQDATSRYDLLFLTSQIMDFIEDMILDWLAEGYLADRTVEIVSLLREHGRADRISAAITTTLGDTLDLVGQDQRLYLLVEDLLNSLPLEVVAGFLRDDRRLVQALEDLVGVVVGHLPVEELQKLMVEDGRLGKALKRMMGELPLDALSPFLRQDKTLAAILGDGLKGIDLSSLSDFIKQQGSRGILYRVLSQVPAGDITGAMAANADILGHTMSYMLLNLIADFIEKPELTEFGTEVAAEMITNAEKSLTVTLLEKIAASTGDNQLAEILGNVLMDHALQTGGDVIRGLAPNYFTRGIKLYFKHF